MMPRSNGERPIHQFHTAEKKHRKRSKFGNVFEKDKWTCFSNLYSCISIICSVNFHFFLFFLSSLVEFRKIKLIILFVCLTTDEDHIWKSWEFWSFVRESPMLLCSRIHDRQSYLLDFEEFWKRKMYVQDFGLVTRLAGTNLFRRENSYGVARGGKTPL